MDEDAELIAGVEKRRILWIVSQSHMVQPRVLDALCIATARVWRDGIFDVRVLLMPVGTHDMDFFAVQDYAVAKRKAADAKPRSHLVHRDAIAYNRGDEGV